MDIRNKVILGAAGAGMVGFVGFVVSNLPPVAAGHLVDEFYDRADAAGHYIVVENGVPTHVAAVYDNDNYHHDLERDSRYNKVFLGELPQGTSLQDIFGASGAVQYEGVSDAILLNTLPTFTDPDGDGIAQGTFYYNGAVLSYSFDLNNKSMDVLVDPETYSRFGLYIDGQVDLSPRP